MFTKIKNVFSKKNKEEKSKKIIDAAVAIYVEDDTIHADIQIKDDTDESLEKLANLLSHYNANMMLEILGILRNQYQKEDRIDVYSSLVEKLIEVVDLKTLSYSQELTDNSDEPIVDPENIF